MRLVGNEGQKLRQPVLLQQAKELATYLQTLSAPELKKIMHLSELLSKKTHQLLADWNDQPSKQSLALDSFVGDIYRGLRASELSQADRDYADKHLYILSGLYGCIRPYDGISPYRLELMYKLPRYRSLYEFWGSRVAECLPKEGPIVNVSSVEYAKVVQPYLDSRRVVSPEFLTVDSKTGEPTFFAVHAKVARGAFARWMIQNRIEAVEKIKEFNDLNYVYDPKRSTHDKPTFVCKTFGGLGLTA